MTYPPPLQAQPASPELAELFEEARRESDRVPDRALTDMELLVALQRRYAIVWENERLDQVIPEDITALRAKTIGPRLSEREVVTLLFGHLAEAQHTYLKLYNTSQRLSVLEKDMARMGLSHVLDTFEPELQAELRDLLRYLAP